MALSERKSRVMSEKERKIVAYHELGHAIVALKCLFDPVHKVSILPRGRALDYIQLPIADKYLISKTEIESQIKILMGGRIAENLHLEKLLLAHLMILKSDSTGKKLYLQIWHE